MVVNLKIAVFVLLIYCVHPLFTTSSLPPTESFDVVVICGARSVDNVPVSERELCNTCKPGKILWWGLQFILHEKSWLMFYNVSKWVHCIFILYGCYLTISTEAVYSATLLHCHLFPLGGCVCMTCGHGHNNVEYKAALEHELRLNGGRGALELCSCH